MYALMGADDNMPEAPFECENNSEAFQRIGPSSDDVQYDEFAVDYWPCTYDEGADPEKLRELQATFAKEHYANGAKGGYRFIYPGAGGPRGQGPDFWISAGAPGLAARGENSDIFGKSHTVQLPNVVDGIICLVTHHLHGMATV